MYYALKLAQCRVPVRAACLFLTKNGVDSYSPRALDVYDVNETESDAARMQQATPATSDRHLEAEDQKGRADDEEADVEGALQPWLFK